MDKETIDTLSNISKAYMILKKLATSIFCDKVILPPIDYKVPDFGVDTDIANTLKHGAAAEKYHGHKFVGPPAKKPAGPPMNYFVPNFGQDPEVTASITNLAKIEKKLKHKIVLKTEK
jgi:hypothetical protein